MEMIPTTLLLDAVCAIHCSIGSQCGVRCDRLLEWRSCVCVCVCEYKRASGGCEFALLCVCGCLKYMFTCLQVGHEWSWVCVRNIV